MKYQVTMIKSDFFKIYKKIKTTDVSVKDESVIFNTDKESLKIIKDSNYNYILENKIKNKAYYYLRKYKFIFIGLLFFISIIYINNYRYENIIFNIDSPINEVLRNDIINKTKNLFFFKFIDLDYNSYSQSLKQQYPEYPYIDVYIKANNIYIDIYNYESNIETKSTTYGHIISKYDGIIDTYYIYNGISKVYKNKYVKKGDILIDSNMNNSYVESSGLILGYTYQKLDISIAKYHKNNDLTGNFTSYYKLNLFDLTIDIAKNDNYLTYLEESSNIFNFFSFFSIKKCIEKEKYDIIEELTYDEALILAKSEIENDFTSNKTVDLEKLTDLVLYNSSIDSNYYNFTFIAKKYVSFGEFKILE